MSKIRVGCLGLGQRGGSMTKAIVNIFPERAEVAAVCDTYEDRTKDMADWIEEKTGKRPLETCDAYEVINNPDVDAICIFTAWEWHIELATAAMRAGKYVGLEVGGAYEVNDCFKLVDTYEQTKKHCMMLENAC
ncbi:MAG: Gfo/Idh/MocA family oxidoreductase, partial [Clostridia bacterium]|nr:Gfo/Idh/MocA family oxidoreductase [Clostridia bacterium]